MQLSTTIFGLPVDAVTMVAERAEAGGFDCVWLADHALTPLEFEASYPYNPTGRPGYPPTTPLVDVWVMIGHLATRLRRLRFGTGVYILPLRHPIVVAQAVRTAYEIADGRLSLGVGTGWMREEFDAMDAQFEHRGRRMDEMLDIMERAWSGEPFDYDGEHYRIAPVQQGGTGIGSLPLVFGGAGDRAIERAAARGDGWFGPPACPLEDAIDHRDEIERRRERHGRADRPFRYYVRVPSAERSDLERFHEAGFDDLVVSLPRRPDGTVDFAEISDFVDAAGSAARSVA